LRNRNFNPNLRYLNFSGNKRLKIKPEMTSHRYGSTREPSDQKLLADFSKLTQLRVLGLMDVTTTFMENVPDDNEERRVRTSLSTVNKMAYGIADNLGKQMGKHMPLTMLDLVQPEFRDHKNEAVFAMFGRSQCIGSNRISKFLHDNFVPVLSKALDELDVQRGETIPDALRRAFLHLNKALHDDLFDTGFSKRKMSQGSDGTAYGSTRHTAIADARSGASGVVLYLAGKNMYIANAGDALAVVSRRGAATPLSRKHDPFDRQETARIRAAEGWVSPKGCVNDEVDVSRSFGYYHLFPVINARPEICTWELSDLDEFVVIGNRGLWDYVDYQTAVDIARSERTDPMIAAQKLRDFAISYGAEGSTMIMVISVGDLFASIPRRPTSESLVDVRRARKKDDITIRQITRLNEEVPPPVGHVALVFTDIRNSTHLWEANAGMPTAMRLHNNLLRRQLRFCGGYEVKTEGDAFMCSFPTALSAVWWCMIVQSELLKEPWPLEILECEDGKEVHDAHDGLIARGLSVRMGVHCGQPLCEPDPITKRMDYFGPMVNRSARISGRAAGGQIMVSADIIREINAKIFESDAETEYSEAQPPEAILAIKSLGISIVSVGEVKLKGLEVPENLSIVYPSHLAGRKDLDEADSVPSASGSRVQFSVDQIRELAMLCVRLETLTTGRIFRPLSERKRSAPREGAKNMRPPPIQIDDLQEEEQESIYVYGDANLLFPTLSETASDADLMMVLESLSIRIMNVVPALCLKAAPDADSGGGEAIMDALAKRGPLDDQTLARVLAVLGC
jgi:adenylate cyclase